jgi:hypothetical protein
MTMSEKKKNEESAVPMSTQLAAKGIQTDADFAGVFTALIGDTLSGAITPNVANASCNAAGKLLKMIELRSKYGRGEPMKLVKTSESSGNSVREAAIAKLTPCEREALGL